MRKSDRFGKTLVFCVDQEHAHEMRRALNNLNADLVRKEPDYVCRVTADEGSIGRGHLSRFQELETFTPAILTTSRLLTTGVDAPMVKNVVLARVVGSMTEFKQIIGRGTRVRDDYGKYFFSILDYTGSATRHFADPDFDGDPVLVTEETIDEEGKTTAEEVVNPEEPIEEQETEIIERQPVISEALDEAFRRKFYVDNGSVEIAAHLVYELDTDGKQLRVVKYTDYTAEKVRTLYPKAGDLRLHWANPVDRTEIIQRLAERGIEFEELMKQTNKPEADPFDLLCHVAYNAPLRTRRERADRLRKDRKDFFDNYGLEARAVLEDLLDKYTEYGVAEFTLPDVLKGPPISDRGNVAEIIQLFGGTENLRNAVTELQQQLYAA
jgi:type I restriction enzyme R subunit